MHVLHTPVLSGNSALVCVRAWMLAPTQQLHRDGHLRWQQDRWYVGRPSPVHALKHPSITDTCTHRVSSLFPDSRIHTVIISSAVGYKCHQHHEYIQDSFLWLLFPSAALTGRKEAFICSYSCHISHYFTVSKAFYCFYKQHAHGVHCSLKLATIPEQKDNKTHKCIIYIKLLLIPLLQFYFYFSLIMNL